MTGPKTELATIGQVWKSAYGAWMVEYSAP
jgi:hypothetical protein